MLDIYKLKLEQLTDTKTPGAPFGIPPSPAALDTLAFILEHWLYARSFNDLVIQSNGVGGICGWFEHSEAPQFDIRPDGTFIIFKDPDEN